MSSGQDNGRFDPELDLLDRYDRMIDVQIDTINEIDDKAAYTGRLIAILGGLLLTTVSIAVSSESMEVSEGTAGPLIMVGVGTTTLFLALLFAIITYLSSKFVYGPPAKMGTYLAEYSVDPGEYRDVILRGYSAGIGANTRVVAENSRRFKWCLTTLLASLLQFFGAGVLLVLPNDFRIDVAVMGGFVVGTLLVTNYVLREEYIILADEKQDNE